MSRRRALSTRPLTYDAVGLTAPGERRWTRPKNYTAYEKTVEIGTGSRPWEFASAAVLAWEIKTRSGFLSSLTANLGPSGAYRSIAGIGWMRTFG